MNKKEFQLSVSETIEQYQVSSIDQGLTEAASNRAVRNLRIEPISGQKNRQVAFAAATIP